MKRTLSFFVAGALALGSLTLAQSAIAASKPALALAALNHLPLKGRAPKTGYSRDLFSNGWGRVAGCDTRNFILARDLTKVTFTTACTVNTGVLKDPYTGKIISFRRGVGTSLAVQIDHVVALSDAWQKGGQKLTAAARYSLYNDPLNLLAVDGPTNQQKSDSDAASWLPPSKPFRCQYVSRQIAVKAKYHLWVTSAEKATMKNVLATCPNQRVPVK